MRVLVTGAGGFLAWELIRRLRGRYELTAATSTPEKLRWDAHFQGVRVVENQELFHTGVLEGMDTVIHTAFCRSPDGAGLAESLRFSQRLFERSRICGVRRVMNLSSQSVYGSEKEGLPAEDAPCAPGYPYAVAKLASELLLESIAGAKMDFLNLRLASLAGVGRTAAENVVFHFAVQALRGEEILIQGGGQRFSFLDIRDAAEAISRLLGQQNWPKTLNLGPTAQIGIEALAQTAVDAAMRRGALPVPVVTVGQPQTFHAGMCSQRLYRLLNWTPRFSMADTIDAILDTITQQGGSDNA